MKPSRGADPGGEPHNVPWGKGNSDQNNEALWGGKRKKTPLPLKRWEGFGCKDATFPCRKTGPAGSSEEYGNNFYDRERSFRGVSARIKKGRNEGRKKEKDCLDGTS